MRLAFAKTVKASNVPLLVRVQDRASMSTTTATQSKMEACVQRGWVRFKLRTLLCKAYLPSGSFSKLFQQYFSLLLCVQAETCTDDTLDGSATGATEP